ncbi:hypothetical protein GQ600_25156 [Phytophthora cactorum]|nr:hypothetical protein GQ600_25156 [Phytophthora cactorum]
MPHFSFSTKDAVQMNETTSYDAASYWTVHCTPGGSLCDDDEAFVVIVTSSDDVVLRYEDSILLGMETWLESLMVIDSLPVLELSAKEGKLDVVLLRKERVQQVVNQGSGNIAVHVGVLVTSGPGLTVSALGTGDVSLTSTSITVDKLTLSSQGSGRLQASFSDFKVKTASVEASSSADATVVVQSTAATDYLVLTVQGSGSLCLSAGSSIETSHLNIKKIELTTTGSGTVDAGGIQCHNVNVDLLGSGNVVVQATGSLSGDVYGSGHLKYYGDAPNSIDNINYMGLVTASPVSGSVGYEFSYDVAIDQSNLVYLAGIVFLVALVLRWFNESRRRAREEQRQPLSVVDGTLFVTSMEPTRSNELNGAFLEKIWTIHAEAGDVLDDLKVQVAGNVFVDYDASLRGADGTVAAKVIMRSSSPDMANLVDVTVHEADGSGVRVHYKNTNARVIGEVVTQIIVSDRNALSSVSAAHSDSVVLGEGVVVSDDPSASLELDTSGDAEITIDIASSGDGHVQFLASSVQADTVTVSLSGDSKAVIVATDRITVDSMVTAISGDGKIFVETANLQSQKLSASLSGDGKVSYSSGGSCVDQTIHLSGDASVYAGSIVCYRPDHRTLTSVGGGSVKYVNAAPHRIVSSSIFRKHSNVKPAKYNKFKTRRPSIPPTRAPKELTIVVKAAWFGDSPHVSVYSGLDTQFLSTARGSQSPTLRLSSWVGPFSVFAAVAGVAAIAIIVFKFHERKSREQYAPLV